MRCSSVCLPASARASTLRMCSCSASDMLAAFCCLLEVGERTFAVRTLQPLFSLKQNTAVRLRHLSKA